MSDSAAFELATDELESSSTLSRMEARGTVRIALKQAGLEPRTVSSTQMTAVFQKIMPGELDARGIESAGLCDRVLARLGRLGDSETADASPDDIFRHLAGED